MKIVTIALFFLSAAIVSSAQSAVEARLTGIVFWKNEAQALLELLPANGAVQRPILGVDQSVAGVQVIAIDEKAGTVGLLWRDSDKKAVLDLGIAPTDQLAQRTFHFRSADLGQVLEIYQQVSSRTVLRSAHLKFKKIDLRSDANLPPEQAIKTIERAISGNDGKVKQIGTKFNVVFDPADEKFLKSLASPPAPDAADEVFPPGLIKFTEADPSQVLEVYYEFTKRPRIKLESRHPGKITLRTQTPLTHPEAVWLLEAALLLNGVPILPASTKLN